MSKNREMILASYEDFIRDEIDIEIFEKSKRLTSLVEIPSLICAFGVIASSFFFIIFTLSYPSALLANNVQILGFLPATPVSLEIIGRLGGLSALCLFGMFPFVYLESKFEERAYSTGINNKKYQLDILGRGVSAFRDNDYSQALTQLEEFNELDEKYIPDSMGDYINSYINKNTVSGDEEFIEETYEDFVVILMEEILVSEDRREKELEIIANPGVSDYFEESNKSQGDEKTASITYFGIIKDTFSGYSLASFKPNFWVLYLIAAAVGIATFMFVNNTLGIISVTILLTALQIYDRREKRKEGGD